MTNRATTGSQEALGQMLPGQAAAARAVMGVMTHGRRDSQLPQWARSLEIAAAPLAELNLRLAILTAGDVNDTPWPTMSVPLETLPSQGDLGFSQSMNRLMARAFANSQTTWFLCVDASGVFHRETLVRLVAAARAHPQSLIEARQFPREHTKQYDPVTGETPWACGACLLIPRTVYETIGGFDPVFVEQLADVDFSWRARRAGFTVRVCGGALFGHGAAQEEPADLAGQRQLLLSARYLAFKWGHEPTWRMAEERLLAGGHFVDREALPTLPNLGPWEDRDRAGIADFSQFFWFAPTRW